MFEIQEARCRDPADQSIFSCTWKPGYCLSLPLAVPQKWPRPSVPVDFIITDIEDFVFCYLLLSYIYLFPTF